MAYELAKEKKEWIHTPVITWTNCIDKKIGHLFEWVNKEEKIEIQKQFPRLGNGIGICKCVFCGKITQSM